MGSWADFIKCFNDSFNIKDRHVNNARKHGLSLFNFFLKHENSADHVRDALVSYCPLCLNLIFNNEGTPSELSLKDRLGVQVGDWLPHIDFFEDYNLECS